MSDAVVVALIVAVPTVITAVSGLIVSIKNMRETSKVAHSVNGLLAASKAAAKAEGVLEGTDAAQVTEEARQRAYKAGVKDATNKL